MMANWLGFMIKCCWLLFLQSCLLWVEIFRHWMRKFEGHTLAWKLNCRNIWYQVKNMSVGIAKFFWLGRLPNVLISIAKKFFDSNFPPPCFKVSKASYFTSSGAQNHKTKNRRLGTIVMSFQDSKPREKQISPTFSYFLINNALLYHFLANWLAHNKKVTEKSVFC